MIGHRVAAALREKEEAKPARPKRVRRRKRSSVCQACGQLRQAGSNGKLPPHRCTA
jgi:hypothetical protein